MPNKEGTGTRLGSLAISASIEFKATGTALSFGHGNNDFDRRPLRLYFPLNLARHEKLKLATGEKVPDEIRLNLTVTQKGEVNERIGAMYYVEENEHYMWPRISIEVCVPTEQFDALLSSALVGRYPDSIDVSAKGLKYGEGWPDGSAKEWDNTDKGNPICDVESISFGLPLAGYELVNAAEEGDLPKSGLPVTREAVEAISQRVSQIQKSVDSICSSVGWLFFAGICAIVVWLWKNV